MRDLLWWQILFWYNDLDLIGERKTKKEDMKNGNYLALADQIDFNDQKQTKTALVKMIWLEIIL